jgi:hypothetical protein
VTRETLVGIVARAQAVGIGMELGKYRIEFAQSRDRRAVGDVGAFVAGGLELAGAHDSFQEGCKLVVVDGGTRGGIRADYWGVWNGNSLLLQASSSIIKPASDAGIFLSERAGGDDKQGTRDRQILDKPLHFFHNISVV